MKPKKFPGVVCDARLVIYCPAEIVGAYRRARQALGCQVVDGEIFRMVLRLEKSAPKQEEAHVEYPKPIPS